MRVCAMSKDSGGRCSFQQICSTNWIWWSPDYDEARPRVHCNKSTCTRKIFIARHGRLHRLWLPNLQPQGLKLCISTSDAHESLLFISQVQFSYTFYTVLSCQGAVCTKLEQAPVQATIHRLFRQSFVNACVPSATLESVHTIYATKIKTPRGKGEGEISKQ